MARVIAGATVSLDGFVADADGNAGTLYPDLAELRDTPFMQALIEETGAVVDPTLANIKLEKISVVEVGQRTNLRFKVGT